MIDREKVIRGLERCDFGDFAICHKCPYYQSHDCTDELKNDILALLKAQEPVLPIFTWEMADITSDLEKIAYCSNCGHKLGRLRVNYCENCGRAVKWMQMN